MTGRPELLLLNVAYDVNDVHGRVFFRNPPSTELRQVTVRSTEPGNICEPAHGHPRDGWEPLIEESRWLIALTRPGVPEGHS